VGVGETQNEHIKHKIIMSVERYFGHDWYDSREQTVHYDTDKGDMEWNNKEMHGERNKFWCFHLL